MRKTTQVVSDGCARQRLPAEYLGQIEIKKNEMIRRIEEGTLSYNRVMTELQQVIEGRTSLVFSSDVSVNELTFWMEFYRKHFGFTADFRGLKIPPKPTDGNWRLLVILKGLTNNQVYSVCEKQFPCWKYTDNLDKAVPTNERDPKTGTYAIWVRDIVEADPVHKNKSANMIKEASLKTETLLERMLHELKYFAETGKHLDVSNVTLCSGSRDSVGYVPRARCYDDKFRVHWYDAGDRNAYLRPREVVAL